MEPWEEEFFDAAFRTELEELVDSGRRLQGDPHSIAQALPEKLAQFLAPPAGQEEPLSEEGFVSLSAEGLAERINSLIDMCRLGAKREAGQAVESFIVFFQALIPTLSDEGSSEIKRVFFRLAPALIQIAYNDFSDQAGAREEGFAALRSLERVLIEIASIRLAPIEKELVFRSIDQMTAFIGVAEYAMANEIISSQLLSIIRRNKLARALYRLMHVEVSLQRYLHEKFGYQTPQIRIPQDLSGLGEYGPIRVLHEDSPEGPRRFIQIQLPEIAAVRNVVLHLVSDTSEQAFDLKLDALGTTELSVPDGSYRLGLVYQPES